jgi:hypothetical protein
VVGGRIHQLFKHSIAEGVLPRQWLHAKIIPLKKPGKNNYTVAKAWRPISLLATLGKVLEALVAERISYLVEEHGLLPQNHFGARKHRSTEQALILLQEHIYKAWRGKKVVSLLSFDVKGAYNGVHVGRLVNRLRERRVPRELCNWVEAFCNNRTANVQVNGHTSPPAALPQAGLPQGSPLSPILFLFFNANLVAKKIDANGGSMAFVDDYSPWVIGPLAEANMEALRGVVDKALAWERCSGATFEGEKTSLIHFTRNAEKDCQEPLIIKGKEIQPKQEVKLLGVLMDKKLRFKGHMERAANKGLKAALALRRLRGLNPRTSRQLFMATIAPAMDYASTVWGQACRQGATKMLQRAQRIGVQSIIGAFTTTSTAIAQSEAGVASIRDRHHKQATELLLRLGTFGPEHPLSKLPKNNYQRFRSPVARMRNQTKIREDLNLEKIKPFAISPWRDRIGVVVVPREHSENLPEPAIGGVLAATAVTSKKNRVTYGYRLQIGDTGYREQAQVIGPRNHTNQYVAELVAIEAALRGFTTIPRQLYVRITSESALKAIKNPRQQSGQKIVTKIYEINEQLRNRGTQVVLTWLPSTSKLEIRKKALRAAMSAAKNPGHIPDEQPQMLATIRNNIKRNASREEIPAGTGKHTVSLDAAIPGKHTKHLYDSLNQAESRLLAQVRTGMSHLNSYLHKIGEAESAACRCGAPAETVKHFLFGCIRWESHREAYRIAVGNSRFGDLSYCLGGKSSQIDIRGNPIDKEPWKPVIDAVRATVDFIKATGRLAGPKPGQWPLLRQ